MYDYTFCSFDDSEFDEIMTQCLLHEKIDFIKVLVMNGFSMQNYLTVAKLR